MLTYKVIDLRAKASPPTADTNIARVAGTMAANGSGLQGNTVRSLLLAWVLTLPASIVLAGALYWAFKAIF